MTRNQKKRPNKGLWSFPFYPVLFGVYPVLALTAINITQIDVSWTYRSFAFSVILSLALLVIARLALRSWWRAAFLTFLLLVLFFSYGHIYALLKNPHNPLLGLVRHRYLATAWTGLAGFAVWLSTRKSLPLAAITPILNIVCAGLLVFPLFQTVDYGLKISLSSPAQAIPVTAPADRSSQPAHPDIYYIILDAYMRSDNIQRIYNYDNSAFIKALTERGFYVADCSQSNYAYTQPSLASSLNFDYLDKLPAYNDDLVNSLIRSNAIRQFLEARGYTVVAFETGWNWSEWKDADVYYQYHPDAYLLNSFESMFLQTTAVSFPLDFMNLNESATSGALQHNLTIYNLNLLKDLPGAVASPKFVFAHLIIPHPLYVFGPDGKFVVPSLERSADLTGYPAAVEFIDKALLQVIDRIIAGSKTPPVIVVQGDHGAFRFDTPAQRMSILNAYYLPGSRAALYATISPVNTFRIILDAYFGQDYPLLKDVSWYSSGVNRYEFEKIPNGCGN